MKINAVHPPKRAPLLRAFGTLIALVLLVYLLSQQGWDEITAAFQRIPAWQLFLAFGVMMVSRLAVSARWYVLLRSSGAGISLGQSMRITFAGLFASNFLPTTVGGDVIRLAGALQLKLDAAISTASLVVDRLVGMAGMAMAVPFGLPRLLEPGALQQAGRLPIFMAGFASLPLGNWWRSSWEKGLKIFYRLLEALALWLRQPRALFASLVFTWVHMLCLFAILALLFDGMGDQIPVWLIAGLYSIVYFVTLLPISINGYGVQELIMAFVFSSLGKTSWADGLTAAILFRTLMMLASLPGALFVPGMLAGTNRGQQ